MKNKLVLLLLCIVGFTKNYTQTSAKLFVYAEEPKQKISRHIYGHFSEHLGRCIYDGFWVSDTSSIPKKDRLRLDVITALKNIKIPNLRWPGGCFADEYHWRDGIGARNQRPTMINTNWGNITEDNSFGTHEFLELCNLLKCDPYITANVGSGTVDEMSKWVEYLNFDGLSPVTTIRKQNGHPAPFNVSFWGVGNESWGCGGRMTPEYYANEFRRYSAFAKNYPSAPLKRIASGPNNDDYNWTDVLMKNAGTDMWGLTLHYYVVPKTWRDKGSATIFDENEYFATMQKAIKMDELITKNSTIMDKYDPEKKVALVVDEWGIWTKAEPGTNPRFLYQQNSMRDALIAGTTLNIFNNHADRVKMANLAQTINVLQALILTEGNKMLLTPTYHVFDLFKVHQDATLLPIKISSPDYSSDAQKIPAINVSASIDSNKIVHISLVNIDATKTINLKTAFSGFQWKNVSGNIVTSGKFTDYNSFTNADKIKIVPFNGAKKEGDNLVVDLPPLSVVVLELK